MDMLLDCENKSMQTNVPDWDLPLIDPQVPHREDDTQKLPSLRPKDLSRVVETPFHLLASHTKQILKKSLSVRVNEQDVASTRLLQEQCWLLCLSLFFREEKPVRSLGFTSSIRGEGKSLLALATAKVLAHHNNDPVTLVECNWEHPTLHKSFDIPATPGLAEWLRGTCDKNHVRYQVNSNLTVIPAGNGTQDAVKLLKQAQHRGLQQIFKHPDELLIVDLPPVITSYGSLAASLAETVVIVVRSEVIPASILTETCAQLKGSPIHGIILNQENSRIPRWIQQIL
jgi:Mrp family chromosome partitioning ATPase